MLVFRGLPAQIPFPEMTAVTFGNFDGVHLGHQAILRTLVQTAKAKGLRSVVITFFPHPLKILAPERAPTLLQSLEDRLESLEGALVDCTVVVPFTLDFASLTAQAFLDRLVNNLKMNTLVVGEDARFGAQRQGDISFLRSASARMKFELLVVESQMASDKRISSSRIRKLLAAGEVQEAALLLSRPFSITGEVVRGEGRGRELGFPTANLLSDAETMPMFGVYACQVEAMGKLWLSAVHNGPIPTFGCKRPALEAHIIGFNGELKGHRIRVLFHKFLRPIQKFENSDALRAQIRKDVEETLKFFGQG
jgi:riboflavin kinase/FMN adenylyltransferase